MRLFFIIILFLLSGCGDDFCEKPDFHAAGLDVCAGKNIDPVGIELTVQTVEEKIQEVYPKVTDIVSKFEEEKILVVFIDDSLSIGCEEIEQDIYRCDDNIGGVTLDYGRKIYVIYKCWGYRILGHELLHAIEYFYLSGPQGDHETPYLFNRDATNQGLSTPDMVEYKINIVLNDLCS